MIYKPGGFCSNPDCPCQHGNGWVCDEFKAMDPGDEYCAECGYDRQDHRKKADSFARVFGKDWQKRL